MKETPLHQWHIDHGAHMAEFGSYDMPLWYPEGVKQEHLRVIQQAGLFDTSHMATLLVKGRDARNLLQHTFTKDLDRCIGRKKEPLFPSRCVYGLFLLENGHVLDDAIVYQIDDSLYMVVINANMGEKVRSHLLGYQDFNKAEINDLTGSLGKIDIQGPLSAKILMPLLKDSQTIFTQFPYFSFKGWFEKKEKNQVILKGEIPILLSRTGYTGEFGFEIFVDSKYLQVVWQMLLDTAGDKLVPCGLAARDSLRAGAVLPLSHQDIGDFPFHNNPWPFALPMNDDGEGFTKKFVGSHALHHSEDDHHTYGFAGYDPRKIAITASSFVADETDQKIGEILTCTTDMAIGRVEGKIISVASAPPKAAEDGVKLKGLSCGFVKLSRQLNYGENVFLTDGKRKVKVEIRSDIRPERTARLALQTFL